MDDYTVISAIDSFILKHGSPFLLADGDSWIPVDDYFDELPLYLQGRLDRDSFTGDELRAFLRFVRKEISHIVDPTVYYGGKYYMIISHGYMDSVVRKFTKELKKKGVLSYWDKLEYVKYFRFVAGLLKENKEILASKYLAYRMVELSIINSLQKFINEEEERRHRLREEQKALKELKKEKERAEKDVEKANAAIKKNEAALDKAKTSAQVKKLQQQIEELKIALQHAEERRDRAISMAQQTRCGYVYVISNIGSFGEGVYKIGMTRRIDPMQRVRELGDASVPYPFDVHAMIYTEDAPGLESHLHKVFDLYKVNTINWRKEYFRVPLDKIQSEVERSGIQCEWVSKPEASQYYESERMRSIGNLDAEELNQYMLEHPNEFRNHKQMFEYDPFEELEDGDF